MALLDVELEEMVAGQRPLAHGAAVLVHGIVVYFALVQLTEPGSTTWYLTRELLVVFVEELLYVLHGQYHRIRGLAESVSVLEERIPGASDLHP